MARALGRLGFCSLQLRAIHQEQDFARFIDTLVQILGSKLGYGVADDNDFEAPTQIRMADRAIKPRRAVLVKGKE